MSNPALKAAFASFFVPTAAFAEEAGERADMMMRQAYESFRGGTISYTKFKELVNSDSISRVIVNEDNTADFRVLNLQTGLQGTGKVYLAPDPDFFTMLRDHGVDLTVARADQTM